MPKSVILTRGPLFSEVRSWEVRLLTGESRASTSTFSGFTSRWITPSSCACPRSAAEPGGAFLAPATVPVVPLAPHVPVEPPVGRAIDGRHAAVTDLLVY